MDDRSARRRRVGELLEVMALTEYADRRLRGFSGGMRQRSASPGPCWPIQNY